MAPLTTTCELEVLYRILVQCIKPLLNSIVLIVPCKKVQFTQLKAFSESISITTKFCFDSVAHVMLSSAKKILSKILLHETKLV
jgi:hypothetical protein